LNAFFDRIVDVERITVGKRQTVDTLICEEALLFGSILDMKEKCGLLEPLTSNLLPFLLEEMQKVFSILYLSPFKPIS
jgi:hypothetical protein